MESWKLSRAGVINFWYYDEETFHFEDGRLLLRGSNGSGKSVTMQSLVPLLFDGNKSPERLDPFGSKARKMESYLLSDGLDLEERTGYLFLEFEKAATGRYMTIGMGMRARKNVPLQTWYFIVLDNRRIGHAHDFTLYKEMGDKIPLTQRELENKIAQGGHVFSKQTDYKKAVNEHLFGYSEITDFDELITLLIQIRSPKLSKEFKPTTMYEIMQSSLVTLTDEDLRPMSEAIENMDEIKLKIDALNASKKSLSKIQTSYDKYNAFMLSTKAKRYLGYVGEWSGMHLEQTQHTEAHKAAEARIVSIEEVLLTLTEEEKQLKRQEESLQKHDLSKVANEGERLKESMTNFKSINDRKSEHIEKEESNERDLKKKISEKQSDLEATKHAMEGLLDSLTETAEGAGFDEFEFFKAELAKASEAGAYGQEGSPFKYHKSALSHYSKSVKSTLMALRDQTEASNRYDASLKSVEASGREVAKQTRAVTDNEQQLNEIKSEFAEKTFRWAEHNHIFKAPREVLQKVTERIYAYNEPYRYDQAIEALYAAYEQIKQVIEAKRHEHLGVKANHLKALQILEDHYRTTESQKDPVPKRQQAVVKNREKLTALGIAHMPLYMAIDFGKSITEATKGNIEEALTEMGLLDALLIAPEHQDIVEKMDKGHADKYIFASPEYLSHNLTELLAVDEKTSAFSKNQIEDVLMSVLLNPSDSKLYIEEDGTFGMGILKGKVSGEQPSRFIGQAARKRYKQALLEQISSDIKAVQVQVEDINALISNLQEQRDLLESEWKTFPQNEDLEIAYAGHKSAQQALIYLQNEEKRLREISERDYETLKEARLRVAEASKGLYLTLQLETYALADESIMLYAAELSALEAQFDKKGHTIEFLESLKLQLEKCLEQLDDYRYEKTQNDREWNRAKVRLEDIQKQLSASDFMEIQKAFEACQLRLRSIPDEKEAGITERASLKAKSERYLEQIDQLSIRKIQIEHLRTLYQVAFDKELDLGYIVQKDLGQASVDKSLSVDKSMGVDDFARVAKKILESHGSILEENKTILDHTDLLKEKFIKESSELAEYHLKMNQLFRDICDETASSDDISHIVRHDFVAKVQGKQIKFHELATWIETQIVEQSSLLSEQDRTLFEEILINSISKKISGKIYHSEEWVKKIDELMSGMNNSSALSFHLKWVTREAESEEQLSTKELVSLLRGDQALLTREQKDRLIRHFQSKIAQSKSKLEDQSDNRSFLAIMKEILDYRKWFQFQLFYTKKGEKRKELTNNAFFTFSGGEKAMAMYVPLFAAVYAKYSGARVDCPKVVSLDEAFAGVDERNITDMFRLLVSELNLGFIANSQILYGDYETVPALSIYELIRPENATFVTTIRYKWNGHTRQIVEDEDVADDRS